MAIKERDGGGGILLDQGIHMLDLGLFFCSAFDEVHAFIENLRFKKANVEDNAFVMMKNNQGQVFHFHSSMTQWKHMFSLDIDGTRVAGSSRNFIFDKKLW